MPRATIERFATEAELCAAWIAEAKLAGWRVYAETHGFDIWCVVPKCGTALGIEAKLALNIKVIAQASPSQWQDHGPDYRCILVPGYCHDHAYTDMLHRLGVAVFSVAPSRSLIPPVLPPEGLRWWPASVPAEPKYDGGSVAGSPCPITLTPWKQRALRIIARIEARGFITRADFKEVGIDSRIWVKDRQGWLVKHEAEGRYTRGDKLHFDRDHPAAYAAILEEERQRVETKGG